MTPTEVFPDQDPLATMIEERLLLLDMTVALLDLTYTVAEILQNHCKFCELAEILTYFS